MATLKKKKSEATEAKTKAKEWKRVSVTRMEKFVKAI